MTVIMVHPGLFTNLALMLALWALHNSTSASAMPVNGTTLTLDSAMPIFASTMPINGTSFTYDAEPEPGEYFNENNAKVRN